MTARTFATVEASTAHTQAAFLAGNVLRTKKQFYAVSIRKITDANGETVSTKENRTPGQQAAQGDWVLTRLDAAGNPVQSKDGGLDTWCSKEKQVLKTYDVSDAIVASGAGVVWTKKGPIVHMVKMTEDTQIRVSWGTQDGKKDDYFANYDYDEANATPGTDFAIVAADSWVDTYEIA